MKPLKKDLVMLFKPGRQIKMQYKYPNHYFTLNNNKDLMANQLSAFGGTFTVLRNETGEPCSNPERGCFYSISLKCDSSIGTGSIAP